MPTLDVCKPDRNRDKLSCDDHVARSTRKISSVQYAHNVIAEFADALARKARLAVVLTKLPALQAAARELFDSVSVEIDVDPEISDSQYVVLCVTAHGAIEEISRRKREWHRNTSELLERNCDLVRLLVDVSE